MTLRKLLVILILALTSLNLTSCKTDTADVVWEPDVYVGNSEDLLIKKDAKHFIECKDKKFNEYFCVHEDDLKYIFQKIDPGTEPGNLCDQLPGLFFGIPERITKLF